MYRNQIIQIANILSINFQRTKNPGLIKGYLGIAFFFYYYARYIGLYYYEDMANSLLEEVLRIDIKHMPKTFANGVYGVGWLVKRLIKENFLEDVSGSLKTFEELSQQRYSEKEILFEQMSEPPICSKILIELDASSQMEQNLRENIEAVLNWKGETKGATFWISIIYYIIKNAHYYDKINAFQQYRQRLDFCLCQCLKTARYTKQDLFIINLLQKKYGLFRNVDIINIRYDMLRDAYMNWQTIVYDDVIDIDEYLPVAALKDYLSVINFYIPESHLSMEGLCSLGVNLIKKSEKRE